MSKRAALLGLMGLAIVGCGGGDDDGGGVGSTGLGSARVFVGVSGPGLVGYDESGKLVGQVELDTGATILECDGSAVWFLNAGLAPDQAVYAFDLAGGTVDTIALAPETNPMDLSIGEGAVWVVTGKNQLLAVDPTTRTLEGTTELSTTDVSTMDDYMRVSARLGAVWVTSLFSDDGKSLLALDPTQKAVKASIGVGDGESGVAAGEGAVFVTTRFDTTLNKIDPVAVQIVGGVDLGGDLGGSSNNVAVGFGSVWVLEFDTNALKRVDPTTMTLAADIPLGGVPDAIAIGKDAVWVLLGHDQKLLRVDPASNGIASTVTVPETGYGVATCP